MKTVVCILLVYSSLFALDAIGDTLHTFSLPLDLSPFEIRDSLKKQIRDTVPDEIGFLSSTSFHISLPFPKYWPAQKHIELVYYFSNRGRALPTGRILYKRPHPFAKAIVTAHKTHYQVTILALDGTKTSNSGRINRIDDSTYTQVVAILFQTNSSNELTGSEVDLLKRTYSPFHRQIINRQILMKQHREFEQWIDSLVFNK